MGLIPTKRHASVVFFCPSPLPFGGSTVLSLARGPAGNRTTTGSLSATQECRDTNCTTRTTKRHASVAPASLLPLRILGVLCHYRIVAPPHDFLVHSEHQPKSLDLKLLIVHSSCSAVLSVLESLLPYSHQTWNFWLYFSKRSTKLPISFVDLVV